MSAPPGTVAFRRRPDHPANLAPDPAPLATSDSYDEMPTQGPGYRGPRYQGFPPQYQSGPDPGLPQPDYASYAYEDDSIAVSLMLAAVAAATQQVLLIDADLELRTLSAVDGDQSDAGLVDVAVGRRDTGRLAESREVHTDNR